MKEGVIVLALISILMISSINMPRNGVIREVFDLYKVATIGEPKTSTNENEVELYTIHNLVSRSAGKPYSMLIRYDDDTSQAIIHSEVGILPDLGRVVFDVDASQLDFSCNGRVVHVELSTVDKDGTTTRKETYNHVFWKPEITLSKIHAHRSDEFKSISTSGGYLTVEGHISFGLINSEIVNSWIVDTFLPIGRYRIKVTDGVNSVYSDYAYVTNQGTYISYQNAKNGFYFEEVIDCNSLKLDELSCFIDAAILTEIGGEIIYTGDDREIPIDTNDYFYFSPKNMGMGIGGIPMHGNYNTPAIDIHWPTYMKKLDVGGVDMTLDDETIKLWTEILGGGGAKT